jgi:hypothetical protein
VQRPAFGVVIGVLAVAVAKLLNALLAINLF